MLYYFSLKGRGGRRVVCIHLLHVPNDIFVFLGTERGADRGKERGDQIWRIKGQKSSYSVTPPPQQQRQRKLSLEEYVEQLTKRSPVHLYKYNSLVVWRSF